MMAESQETMDTSSVASAAESVDMATDTDTDTEAGAKVCCSFTNMRALGLTKTIQKDQFAACLHVFKKWLANATLGYLLDTVIPMPTGVVYTRTPTVTVHVH